MTTVGYGDEVPRTLAGRLLGAIAMFSGIALTSLVTADLAGRMMERRQQTNSENAAEDDVKEQLHELTEQVLRLTDAVEKLSQGEKTDRTEDRN